jgi:hypothetical protein
MTPLELEHFKNLLVDLVNAITDWLQSPGLIRKPLFEIAGFFYWEWGQP